MGRTRKGPLEGVRVIDLSTVIAAPFGATLLADFGADVIKVEMPKKGDPLRNLGPYYNGEGLRWPGLSRNKKSLTLDLHHEEGKEILRKLVKKTDILIENFRTGTLEKWGIGYQDLKKINPDLIMIRVTGYGQTGPYAYKAGFGTPATAFSGFTYLHGYPDRPPISPSFSLTDYVTGIYVAFSAVMALYHRDCHEDGTGQYIDVSLYESMFRMMEFLVADYDVTGNIKERTPGLSGHSAPAGNFLTKDGSWVILVTSSDKTFERLAKAMGREDMLTDERYYTNSERLKRFDEVNGIVADWVKTKTKEELQKLLDEYGVPMSPIYSIKDIFEDPHYKARENIVEVDHPRLGKVKIPGVVPKFSETPGAIRQIAPDLGEHTEDILKNLLELDDETIERLKEKNVI
ncbi:CaiB/BaiF CoA transferase family protein [Ureibacillus terrenus]|uniref:CoA transferase n=2 Tax=Bacillati TaxID=1783272 RepID=A0A540V3M9_9BACL|nr:CoA transferase [Ureibacillus terrenus]MED3661863.1 CoA transferase [Ureibacillus terrenus]MED3763164.1 CoA transferase [Ureibacillus terrenus]TQE91331.1 CoA transferase [Ureibacillus terrenus]